MSSTLSNQRAREVVTVQSKHEVVEARTRKRMAVLAADKWCKESRMDMVVTIGVGRRSEEEVHLPELSLKVNRSRGVP